MITYKKKYNSLLVSYDDSQFDDENCNINDEILSEKVKARAPLWFECRNTQKCSFPLFKANEYHEQIDSHCEVVDKSYCKCNNFIYFQQNNDWESRRAFSIKPDSSTPKDHKSFPDELNNRTDSSSPKTLKAEISTLLRALAKKRSSSTNKKSSFSKRCEKTSEVEAQFNGINTTSQSVCVYSANNVVQQKIRNKDSAIEITMSELPPNFEIKF